MSDNESKFDFEEFDPDRDLETHLLRNSFKVHGVPFRHVDLIQSLLYMSTFVHDAITGKNPVKSNTLLITIDDKNECMVCSAGKYSPPIAAVDESNTAIVHGDKTSYFLTNGFMVDNFDLVRAESDYVTDEGEILVTRTDVEELTRLNY